MTRDQHRTEADKLLRLAAQEAWTQLGEPRNEYDQDLVREYQTAALVHALLALSAPDAEATAEQMVGRTVFTGGAT